MPLFDHFHGPIARRPWESFHAQWAGCIAADLNRRLPKQFVADAPMHLGTTVEADVAEYEKVESNGSLNHEGNRNGKGGVAIAAETYAPPVTTLSMPADFPPEVKVEIRDVSENYRLLGVVELVSPSNKKEANGRNQFAAKCLSYLGQGIGLVVIDTVTSRRWNMHDVMVRLAEYDEKFLMPGEPPIYVSAYRPVARGKKNSTDLWMWPLGVGDVLPTVPLALKGYGCVRLDLEATYDEACQRFRISE